MRKQSAPEAYTLIGTTRDTAASCNLQCTTVHEITRTDLRSAVSCVPNFYSRGEQSVFLYFSLPIHIGSHFSDDFVLTCPIWIPAQRSDSDTVTMSMLHKLREYYESGDERKKQCAALPALVYLADGALQFCLRDAPESDPLVRQIECFAGASHPSSFFRPGVSFNPTATEARDHVDYWQKTFAPYVPDFMAYCRNRLALQATPSTQDDVHTMLLSGTFPSPILLSVFKNHNVTHGLIRGPWMASASVPVVGDALALSVFFPVEALLPGAGDMEHAEDVEMLISRTAHVDRTVFLGLEKLPGFHPESEFVVRKVGGDVIHRERWPRLPRVDASTVDATRANSAEWREERASAFKDTKVNKGVRFKHSNSTHLSAIFTTWPSGSIGGVPRSDTTDANPRQGYSRARGHAADKYPQSGIRLTPHWAPYWSEGENGVGLAQREWAIQPQPADGFRRAVQEIDALFDQL